ADLRGDHRAGVVAGRAVPLVAEAAQVFYPYDIWILDVCIDKVEQTGRVALKAAACLQQDLHDLVTPAGSCGELINKRITAVHAVPFLCELRMLISPMSICWRSGF